jgi:hypothetical protein
MISVLRIYLNIIEHYRLESTPVKLLLYSIGLQVHCQAAISMPLAVTRTATSLCDRPGVLIHAE